MNVGVIGLGAMGGNAAKRLVDKGFDLTVFDVRPEHARGPTAPDQVVRNDDTGEINEIDEHAGAILDRCAAGDHGDGQGGCD